MLIFFKSIFFSTNSCIWSYLADICYQNQKDGHSLLVLVLFPSFWHDSVAMWMQLEISIKMGPRSKKQLKWWIWFSCSWIFLNPLQWQLGLRSDDSDLRGGCPLGIGLLNLSRPILIGWLQNHDYSEFMKIRLQGSLIPEMVELNLKRNMQSSHNLKFHSIWIFYNGVLSICLSHFPLLVFAISFSMNFICLLCYLNKYELWVMSNACEAHQLLLQVTHKRNINNIVNNIKFFPLIICSF